MPLPVVWYHEERTEITFDHDGSPHDVALSSLLVNSADAVGVVLEVWNDATTGSVSVTVAGETTTLEHHAIMHVFDRLDGVDKEITLAAASTDVTVAIVAEFVDPGARIHGAKIDKSNTTVNSWQNRNVTLIGGDSAGDVEAVILMSRTEPPASISEVQCRGLGSTTNRDFKSSGHSDFKWFVIAAPNGQYQLLSSGKFLDVFANWWEFGYVKVGYGLEAILNYANDNPSASSGWETRDTTTVPAGADGMFAIQIEASSNRADHGLRAVGSSDAESQTPSDTPSDSCDAVKFSGDRQFGFFHELNPQLWITAYTTGVAGSGAATAKLVASAEPGVPADFAATIEVEDVLGGSVDAEDVLGGSVDAEDVLGGFVTIEE